MCDLGSLDGHDLQIKQLRGEEPVESIDLSRKGLTVLSAVVIASLISSNTATKSLKCAQSEIPARKVSGAYTSPFHPSRSLLRNNLGEEGASAIMEVAKGKPQLTTLCDIKPEETERDFSRQRLNVGDAILLAFDLQNNSMLVKLKCAATCQPPRPCCQQPLTL